MSVAIIKAFSQKAKTDPILGEQLKASQKMKALFALARYNGFELLEDSLHPPTNRSSHRTSCPGVW